MILIEKIIVDGVQFIFYEGIDMDFMISHPKDGSNGFLIFFIDNWVNEVKKYERQKKIKSLLDDEEINCFELDNIDNNYLSIYQTNEVGVYKTYNVIKDKILNKNFQNMPYIPISGIDKGAWKISNSKVLN